MKTSQAASHVIALARKVREYYERELPKHYPNYPLVDEDEDKVPPPPEENELRDYLTSLPDETLHKLMVTMYLGRYDFGIDELADNYQELRGAVGEREFLVDQMIHQAPLADYLLDGLEELRKHNMNVDKLPLSKAKIGKP